VTTEVILTGTGVPHPHPGRAGAGTLVRCGDVALQFDVGRATVLRLVEAGTAPSDLSVLFVTHVHSDHVVDLPDVAMTRWIQQQLAQTGPLVVVAPDGAASRFVRRMIEPFGDDGVVVISGDTRVCTEVEELSAGAGVLVHEACRTTPLAPVIAGTVTVTVGRDLTTIIR
jgi:ribonuclease BN (tRNA processing enzyme)